MDKAIVRLWENLNAITASCKNAKNIVDQSVTRSNWDKHNSVHPPDRCESKDQVKSRRDISDFPAGYKGLSQFDFGFCVLVHGYTWLNSYLCWHHICRNNKVGEVIKWGKDYRSRVCKLVRNGILRTWSSKVFLCSATFMNQT